MSPGNVAVYHGSKMKVIDRRLRVTELLLRCSISCLSLLALILVVTDSQVKQIFTIEKKAKYTDMKALVFLVAANGIAAVYSLLQSVRCAVKGSVLFSKPLAWAIFSGDQALEHREKKGSILKSLYRGIKWVWLDIYQAIAYISVAAIAAAAESGVIAMEGEDELQWMKLCNMYGKFCNRVAEGVASALFAAVAMVLVSCISAFSLFRLYGANKDRRTAPW